MQSLIEEAQRTRALWVLVTVPSGNARPGTFGITGTLHCEGPSVTGSDFVRVRVITEDDRAGLPSHGTRDILAHIFPDFVAETSTSAAYSFVLAGLLGHRPDDVEVPWFEGSR